MYSSEFILVAFTILVQMSVGAFFIYWIFNPCLFKKDEIELSKMTLNKLIFSIMVLIGFTIILSFFHLGSPLKAIYVLSNMSTSWLSREILFLLLFFCCIVIFYFLNRSNLIRRSLLNLTAWITVTIGFLLIISMSCLYMLPTVSTWNTVLTPLSFFVTTILLGILFIYGIVITLNQNIVETISGRSGILGKRYLKYSVTIISMLVIIGIVINIIQLYKFILLQKYFVSEDVSLLSGYSFVLQIRIALAFCGIGSMIYILNKFVTKKTNLSKIKIYVVLILIFISEIMSRVFFYSIYQCGGM